MESACTFFGHRYCNDNVKQFLHQNIIKLIKEYRVNIFYVGNQGEFDRIALSVLKEIKVEYDIECYVVIAYLPQKSELSYDYYSTLYPETVAKSHPKYAIYKRNEWMLAKSKYVIAYAKYPGGAKTFTDMAVKKGKTVINFYD